MFIIILEYIGKQSFKLLTLRINFGIPFTFLKNQTTAIKACLLNDNFRLVKKMEKK